jgi:calcineurin-like phosphoesterase family protein
MAEFFWTADLHLDHSNMIEYCNRPYRDSDHMNEQLLGNINKTVGKGDVLIIAGDLTLWHKKEKVYKDFINEMNGTIICLKGNHDYWLGKGKGRYIYHKKIGDLFTVTCHYAMRVWNRSNRGAIHMHGHSHDQLYPWPNSQDVGVDTAFRLLGEYRPFHLDEILELIEHRKDMKLWTEMINKSVMEHHGRGEDDNDM